MVEASADQALFAYGTLQSPEVQLDTFGRIVAGERDVLSGCTIDEIETDDARVVRASGAAVHPALRFTGSELDKVVGTLLWVTEEELDAADQNVVARCRRVSVTLASGRGAWVYVTARDDIATGGAE